MPKNLPNILLIEDSEDDIFFLTRALKSADIQHPIVVKMDGQAAISYLEDTSPGNAPIVVLLDLKLPRKNGFEVLEWIRQRSQFKSLVVIIQTSSIEAADLRRAYSLGANAYITKMASKDALQKTALGIRDFWLQLNQFETPS